MAKLLYLIGQFLLSDLFRIILTGAGLGLATGILSKNLLDSYIAKVVSASNGIDASALALLNLSGFDVALSVIIGALVARVTINAAKVSLIKK